MDKVIVIGATGGIGCALARALMARGAAVTGLGRASSPPLDLEHEGSIEAAANALAGKAPFDGMLIATGLLHADGVTPEKALRQIDGQAFDRLFRVNVTGPALVMKHFIPLMARDRRIVIAALSARVGSIGDNRLGGWVGYRSAKAALNQLIRTLSIELARTHPDAVMAGLHPGTVDTGLSKPFRRHVTAATLLSPDDSAAHLLDVIGRLTPADSGGCFDWRGERITP